MSDPRHAHKFNPNRHGYCTTLVGPAHCGLDAEALVHTRYREPEPECDELTALRARVAQLEAECADRSSAAVELKARVAELEAEPTYRLRQQLAEALADRDTRIAQVLALPVVLIKTASGVEWLRAAEVRALLVPQEGQS